MSLELALIRLNIYIDIVVVNLTKTGTAALMISILYKEAKNGWDILLLLQTLIFQLIPIFIGVFMFCRYKNTPITYEDSQIVVKRYENSEGLKSKIFQRETKSLINIIPSRRQIDFSKWKDKRYQLVDTTFLKRYSSQSNEREFNDSFFKKNGRRINSWHGELLPPHDRIPSLLRSSLSSILNAKADHRDNDISLNSSRTESFEGEKLFDEQDECDSLIDMTIDIPVDSEEDSKIQKHRPILNYETPGSNIFSRFWKNRNNDREREELSSDLLTLRPFNIRNSKSKAN